MGKIFDTDCFGRKDILSHYSACSSCQKITALNSYTSERFLHLNQFPLFPLGRIHVADECPLCGHRNLVPHHIYQQQRKNDLDRMMHSFTDDPDNPDVTLNALQTLTVHNQETWFSDVVGTYGKRFETDVRIQLKIARGFQRFGQYEKAETYCQNAIALGADVEASALLLQCQSMREKSDANHIERFKLKPESMLLPYAFLLALILVLLGGLTFAVKSALRHHTAWLVNGLPKSYSVEIDGTDYRLEPYELKRVTLRLGKHEMQAHGLVQETEPVTFKYTLSLLDQKRGNHTLVLNPDRLALLTSKENDYYYGEAVRILEEVGRLSNTIPSYPVEVVELLRAQISPAEADAYTRRMLEEVPGGEGTEELLSVVVEKLPIEDAVIFLKQGMQTEQPILPWHVFYQDYVKSRAALYDLENEYALLCEAHPDISEYYYLLGRVARNRESAKLLFEKSLKGGKNDGPCSYAIARDLLCSGQFTEAFPYALKAQSKFPDNTSYNNLIRRIQQAQRQYDPLLEAVRNDLSQDPDNGRLMAEQIKYLTMLGEHNAVEEASKGFKGAGGQWGAYFNAARYYAVGNVPDYLSNLAVSGMDEPEWQNQLHHGNTTGALVALTKIDTPKYSDYLLLYCAARHHNQSAVADAALADGISRMRSATGSQQSIAFMLSQPSPPKIRQVLDLRIWPEEKAVLCTALGFRFPEQQQTYFKLSNSFNYAPQFPQLLLKKWSRTAAASR